jgi:Family of unknown function (DUF5947)
MITALRPRDGIGALRRFVRTEPVEICEFCNIAIPAEHRHLVEPATRKILCGCQVCTETVAGRTDGTYRLVPKEASRLADFPMTDAQWHSLGLPIDMAFLFHSTQAGRPIAIYPGPAGTTESPIDASTWSALVADNQGLDELEPDVEALLINRLKGRRAYYRVPIDRCFALVGLIRTRWRGWTGGDEVWNAIDDFCNGLSQAATPAPGWAR